MTLTSFDTFCRRLPHATHVVQWGDAHVWKIGGKVFAIGGWQTGAVLAVTFKCSPMTFDLLEQMPGCRPAPYLASRGMAWIQRTTSECINDTALKAHLRESYRLASLNLAKRIQLQLGLNQR